VESFWFDRNFAYFLLWKLTNFDEWKFVSLLWEMNSYILQPLFFTSQNLHLRVVFLTFSVCVIIQNHILLQSIFLSVRVSYIIKLKHKFSLMWSICTATFSLLLTSPLQYMSNLSSSETSSSDSIDPWQWKICKREENPLLDAHKHASR
jgi:hypothetical protein